MPKKKIIVLDIGHSYRSLDQAIIALETTVSQASHENKIKIIKVITGHGSGLLREKVRQWCNEQKGRFKGVIYGENYSIFNKETNEMREACDNFDDNDLGRGNSAITYIWLW
mgnify:FL=1|tara:strand:+ start:393 stop:728 length:336 start_codon:yes stop_codon:yes gene_type:complete